MIQLGTYLGEAGQTAPAIELLEQAVATEPNLDALNALGIAYAQAGRAADARSIFERVQAIDTSSSVPNENLGMLALQQDDVARARREFERAVQIDPRSSRAHSGLGTVLAKSGDRVAAVAEWKRAAELDPRNVDALYNAGMTLARAGDRAAARPFLEQFVRTAPPALYAKDLQEASRLLAAR
jgi:Flp pilus assembly protein TadD